MTIFVKRCNSGDAAFVAYACQKVIVVTFPDVLLPAPAATPARASSDAVTAAMSRRWANRMTAVPP